MPPLNTFSRNCLAVAISQALVMPAQAATITVNSELDVAGGTYCTLRNAIIASNDNVAYGGCVAGDVGVSDEIVFDGVSLVNLNSSLPTLTSDVTISGPTPRFAQIVGNGSAPVIFINDATVSLTGLVITGGFSNVEGGGLHAFNSANVNIIDSRVTGNTATGEGGGIIARSSATVSLSNSYVTGNSASYGGGLHVENNASVNLTNSTVRDNLANRDGGGLNATSFASVSLTDSSISDNTAFYYGGGLNATAFASVSLTDSSISDNTALYYGGGLNATASAKVSLTDSTISDNSANSLGGGLYAGNATVTLTNSTVSGNSVRDFGGGLYAYNSASVTLINSTVSGNVTNEQLAVDYSGGGGIFASSSGTVVTLSNSLVAGNRSGHGGQEIENYSVDPGIVNFSGYNLLGDNALTTAEALVGVMPGGLDIIATSDGNTPTTLSAILNPLDDNGGLTLTHSLPPGSPARDEADGTVCTTAPVNSVDQRGAPRTSNCDIGAFEYQASSAITVNSYADTSGGAVCTLRDAILSAENITPYGGCAAGADGSTEISLDGINTITLTKTLPALTSAVTINGNGVTINANNRAFVLRVDGINAVVTLNDLTLTGAQNESRGGGLDAGRYATVTLNNSTVSGNFASDGGGLAADVHTKVTLNNSTVLGNSASFDGGGLVANPYATVTLNNSTVSGNSASSGGGGLVANAYATVTLNNSTVSGNSASFAGGGLRAFYGTITLTNSSVSGNSANFGGGLSTGFDSIVTLTNSTVSGNSVRDFGGGLYAYNSASVTLINSTVSGNVTNEQLAVDYSGGGGIFASSSGTVVTLSNSLVAGNRSGHGGQEIENSPNNPGLVNFTGVNLLGDAAYTTTEALVNVTPNDEDITTTSDGERPSPLNSILRPLADNGGFTQTHALSSNSPATDAGDGTVCTTAPVNSVDQRGVFRTDMCDIGAFEFNDSATITVDSSADTSGGADCTLRDAILTAENISPYGGCASGGDRFTEITLNSIDTITLTHALPNLTSYVTINGNGAIIDASNTGRVLTVRGVGTTSSAMVSLNELTLTGGYAESGGGLYVGSRALVNLTNSTVTGNSARGGGGLAALRETRVYLTNSTVSGNEAIFGGGLYANLSAIVVLNSSTVANNTATGDGGGVWAYIATVRAENSVVSGNRAGSAGHEAADAQGIGSINFPGTNLLGDDLHTTSEAFLNFTPSASNIFATSDGDTPTALADILDPLADNGGPTQTHALVAGSPAIDASEAGRCVFDGILTDQRGEQRDANCDIGAYEFIDDESFFVIPLPNGKVVIFSL